MRNIPSPEETGNLCLRDIESTPVIRYGSKGSNSWIHNGSKGVTLMDLRVGSNTEPQNEKVLLSEGFQVSTLKDFCSKFKQIHNGSKGWVLDNLLKLGCVTLLVAQPKVGKSLLAYDWVRHICRGEEWQGFKVEKSKCLIIQCDEPEPDCQGRLQEFDLDEDEESIIRTDFNPKTDLEGLEKCIAENGIKLIMIDSLMAIMMRTNLSSKDPEYGNFVFNLRDIASRQNCSILLIHHENKGQVSGIDKVFGSTTITMAVSDIWSLKKHPRDHDPSTRILEKIGGRNGANSRYKLKLCDDPYGYEFLGEMDGDEVIQPEEIKSLGQQIIDLLTREPNLAASDISKKLDQNPESIRSACKRLHQSGSLTSIKEGRRLLYSVCVVQQLVHDLVHDLVHEVVRAPDVAPVAAPDTKTQSPQAFEQLVVTAPVTAPVVAPVVAPDAAPVTAPVVAPDAAPDAAPDDIPITASGSESQTDDSQPDDVQLDPFNWRAPTKGRSGKLKSGEYFIVDHMRNTYTQDGMLEPSAHWFPKERLWVYIIATRKWENIPFKMIAGLFPKGTEYWHIRY